MAEYKASVPVQGGLHPMGTYPIAQAHDIETQDGTRLDQKLDNLDESLNSLDDRQTETSHTVQNLDDALEGLVGDTGLVKNYVDESVSQAMAHTDEAVENAISYTDEAVENAQKHTDDAVASIHVSYPIVNNPEDIPMVDEKYYSLDPETYYIFGVVDSLPVYCDDPNDGLIHEFAFEFIPSANFTAIEFGSTAPSWATPVQFPVGRVCQVSIMRGVGVMISA